METNNLRTVRLVAIGFVVLILALIGYYIYTTVTRSGKTAVTIVVVPNDAHVTLNGTTTSGTVYLPPGDYDVEASKEGFTPFSEKTHIDERNQTISIPLSAISDDAKQWKTDNQDEYLKLEAKAGEEADKEGVAFAEKNPITTVLPDENLIYSIGYRADPADPTGNSIIVEIDAAQGYRNAALQEIRNLGYDPTQFKIKFRDYVNPFES